MYYHINNSVHIYEGLNILFSMRAATLFPSDYIMRIRDIHFDTQLFRPPTFLLSGYRLIKECDRAQQLFLPHP